MAKLVAAVGVPHGPGMPRDVARAPGQLRGEALFKQVREQLEAAAPDVIIEISSDHLVNFFYNNFPQFCVGLIDEAEGPGESYVEMPRLTMRGHPELANALLRHCLRKNFDVATTQELRLDHGVLVPLYFLTPSMEIPVVPLYINGLAPPLPTSRRAFALGRTVRRFIDGWDRDLRVAIVASGAISLEVGGPRVGTTDTAWVETVTGLLENGRYQALARRATEERMLAAGNVSGELMNWITMLGAIGDARPLFVEKDRGSGYAAWKLE